MSARPAFTLIEMVVVVGIVMFLSGLTLTVTSSAMRRADVQLTRDTLVLLDMAVKSYEAEADRTITWGEPHFGRYEVNADTEEIFIINEVLQAIERVPASREILSRIDPSLIMRLDETSPPIWVRTAEERREFNEHFAGTLTVVDPWGTPVYATHPGSVDVQSLYATPPDPDGTNRTYNENKYGVAKNRRICFVSAGPDRAFGDFALDALTPIEDNIFSYTIELPSDPSPTRP